MDLFIENGSRSLRTVPNHLLQVVQACKSLLGTSKDHIPHNLLRWLDSHVKGFKPDNDFECDLNSKNSMELLSTFELESIIIQNDKKNITCNEVYIASNPRIFKCRKKLIKIIF